jgi:hypothetical protein
MNAYLPRSVAVVALVAIVLATSAHANAPDGRYTISANTVYDTKTKLTWQRSVLSTSTQYEWAGAKAYCKGLSLDGGGWRLPTIKELETIIDFSQSFPPLIDSTAFPLTPAYYSYFWSSTPSLGADASAWMVNFSYGSVSDAGVVGNSFYVRCVR